MATESASLFTEGLLLLGGAVIAAPIFKRIGLGTVLGYLAAGIVIGPIAKRITDAEEIMHVAELGVVFLLFIIGLELKPARLWAMRRAIFGLGLAQVLGAGLVIYAALLATGLMGGSGALIAGFGLALSSTAFALQLLDDDGATNTRWGQTAFSILLFQDLAIVPLLALASFLAPYSPDAPGNIWADVAIAVAAVAAVVLAGRYLLNPAFRFLGNTGAREVMIAAALFIVIGSGMLLQWAGLSMAMGAFLAGVMLAESSYRHELEADIEPFRGLLLGLFFIAVGLSVDLSVIRDNLVLIAGATLALMVLKAGVNFILCSLFGADYNDAIRVSLLIPQGGEFGFVLFSIAAGSGLFTTSTASILIAIVTLSMALTPVSMMLARRLVRTAPAEEMDEDFDGAGADVLMVGFSRFGQIASQVLLASGRDVTIIDHSADRVRAAQKFGFRIYFGDGTRKDVLEAAGIRRAKIVAVCTHKREITDRIIELIQSEYPNAKIFARAYDRTHTLALRARGVDYEARETFESGLLFGRKTIEALGVDEAEALDIQADVRKRDEERLAIQQVEGIYAGRDKLHTRPVTPEPLIKPTREGRRLDHDPDGRDGSEHAIGANG
ncbi:potassium transporter TrkA [Zhengella mangrovi]|uniref:Potassium transporter TrkA n=1 Tax=Zhengella mangrovi TaxID=1982044 RepID=A0A2G1QL82_9HYPH|nr:monovalent cation:proton antiporter-2 (CPA2) family protein [Zhengella mangrovi]PHP66210.1 potassium transporter TrkA [Zhengella mangrovi]